MISGEARNIHLNKFEVGPLGTNCYLLHDDTTSKGVLIDPGMQERSVADFIRDNNIDVEFTINTHGHADHIMGDNFFGFPVLVHELDAPLLNEPSGSMLFFLQGDVEPVKIDRFVSDGDILNARSMTLKVIHTPGHSPGGISIICDNMLFSGDTLFFEGIGRTDLQGGDLDAIIHSIKDKLFVLPDDTKVFPGHGPETTIGHEKRSNPFV